MRSFTLDELPALTLLPCVPVSSSQQGASNLFCYGSTFPALPQFQEECFVNKRLDTWAHPKRHCRGTTAPDRMDMHFYVYAS